MSDPLEEQIQEAIDQLAKARSSDAKADVLRAFAGKLTVRVEEVKACSSCGEPGAPCFRCKAQEVLGEQASMALPFVLPKLAVAVKDWAQDAWARRQAARAQEQRAAATAGAPGPRAAAPPPPPPGKQSF